MRGLGANIGIALNHKQAGEALQESEMKFKSVAEHSPLGVYMIDGLNFHYVNRRFAEIFGYEVEECLDGLPFEKLIYPSDLSVVNNQVERRLADRSQTSNHTFRGLSKDNTVLDVEVFGSSLTLQGRVLATGTLLDITDRKRAEAEREKLITQLERTLAEVKILRGFIPICANCKKNS